MLKIFAGLIIYYTASYNFVKLFCICFDNLDIILIWTGFFRIILHHLFSKLKIFITLSSNKSFGLILSVFMETLGVLMTWLIVLKKPRIWLICWGISRAPSSNSLRWNLARFSLSSLLNYYSFLSKKVFFYFKLSKGISVSSVSSS